MTNDVAKAIDSAGEFGEPRLPWGKAERRPLSVALCFESRDEAKQETAKRKC